MQDVIVYLIVAGAAVYLGRHWWTSTRKGSCGGCEGACGGKTKKAAEPQLVQIDLTGSFRKPQ